MTSTLRPLVIAVDPENPDHRALIVGAPPHGEATCPRGTTMHLLPGQHQTTEYTSRGTCRPDSRFRIYSEHLG